MDLADHQNSLLIRLLSPSLPTPLKEELFLLNSFNVKKTGK